MNRHINTGATIAFLITLEILAGCATTGKDLVSSNTVKIEKVSSAWGTIGFVTVRQKEEEVTIRGKVNRRPSGRGPIPGHIDLEIIDPEGVILEESVIDYDRPSPKSRHADFNAVLNAAPPQGSTIRLIHDSRVISSGEQGH